MRASSAASPAAELGWLGRTRMPRLRRLSSFRLLGRSTIGALALHHLNRLVIEGRDVVHEERLLERQGWRVRFVKQGPDDLIYLGTDDGKIRRLVPVGMSR